MNCLMNVASQILGVTDTPATMMPQSAPGTPDSVVKMKQLSGVYLTHRPGSDLSVAVLVDGTGKVFAMRPTDELVDEGWAKDVVVSGPLYLQPAKA